MPTRSILAMARPVVLCLWSINCNRTAAHTNRVQHPFDLMAALWSKMAACELRTIKLGVANGERALRRFLHGFCTRNCAPVRPSHRNDDDRGPISAYSAPDRRRC